MKAPSSIPQCDQFQSAQCTRTQADHILDSIQYPPIMLETGEALLLLEILPKPKDMNFQTRATGASLNEDLPITFETGESLQLFK